MTYGTTVVVRVWQRERADGVQWAERLEQLGSRESWHYAEVETLLASLQRLIGPVDNAPRPPTGAAATDPAERSEKGQPDV